MASLPFLFSSSPSFISMTHRGGGGNDSSGGGGGYNSSSSGGGGGSSSSSDSEAFACNNTWIADMMAPHRVPVTVLSGLSAACMIGGSVALILLRNSLMFRRKAALYLIVATVGLLLYLRDSMDIVWTFPAYDCQHIPFLLYYLGAVPIHIIPVLVRSWRTYCIYRETPNIRCSMDSILSKKVRRHKWMLTRMAIAYIPYVAVAFFFFYDEDTTYYLWISVEIVYCCLNLALSWKLFLMRHELRSTMLDETVALFTYAVIAFVETIYSNTTYILAYEMKGSTYLIIYYMYGDIFFATTMWFLTGGKAILIVWTRRHRNTIVQKEAELNHAPAYKVPPDTKECEYY